MGYYLPTPDPNSFYHHGILGMKWGVRRYQPYPSGHSGGKEIGEAAKLKENRKKDKAGYKASKQNLREARRKLAVTTKRVTSAAEEDARRRRQVANAEHELDQVSSKIVLPWNRDKKAKEIEAARYALDRLSRFQENSKVKYMEEKFLHDTSKANYVAAAESLVNKYGKIRLANVKPKEIELGQGYVVKTFKTGINKTNFPLLGQRVSGKYNSNFDKQFSKKKLEGQTYRRIKEDILDSERAKPLLNDYEDYIYEKKRKERKG